MTSPAIHDDCRCYWPMLMLLALDGSLDNVAQGDGGSRWIFETPFWFPWCVRTWSWKIWFLVDGFSGIGGEETCRLSRTSRDRGLGVKGEICGLELERRILSIAFTIMSLVTAGDCYRNRCLDDAVGYHWCHWMLNDCWIPRRTRHLPLCTTIGDGITTNLLCCVEF